MSTCIWRKMQRSDASVHIYATSCGGYLCYHQDIPPTCPTCNRFIEIPADTTKPINHLAELVVQHAEMKKLLRQYKKTLYQLEWTLLRKGVETIKEKGLKKVNFLYGQFRNTPEVEELSNKFRDLQLETWRLQSDILKTSNKILKEAKACLQQ